MTLTQGTTYRAYLTLPLFATWGMARDKLKAAGFADVKVYEVDRRLCVQGRWTGATRVVDLPSELSSVTEVRT